MKLVKKIARGLVYVSLDGSIGRRIRIHSAEMASVDAVRALKDDILAAARFVGPDLRYRDGTAAKYGILDLAYVIDEASLKGSPIVWRRGVPLLRELGLLEPIEPSELEVMTSSFLEDLVTEIDEGQFYLKLFLEDEEKATPKERLVWLRDGVPPDFWPRDFTISDACLTNARSVWTEKHFYI